MARFVGISALALTTILGLRTFAPDSWPTIPTWATIAGIAIGVLVFGIGIGQMLSGRAQSSTRGYPELRLSVVGARIFTPDGPDVGDRRTGIALDALVWNSGADSFATNWTLRVMPKGAAPSTAELTKIPDMLRLGGAADSAVIRASDSLSEKTLHVPITSCPTEGMLLFYVRLRQDTVLAPSTRLELAVKDAKGAETSVSKPIGDWLRR